MSPSREGDGGVYFINAKYFTRENFTFWEFVFGVIFLLAGLVCLHLTFNPPYLGYFTGWLQNRNTYLYLAVVSLLASSTSFLDNVYEKYTKGKSAQTKEGDKE
nr:hypothetical protein [Candidatus Freyarchaeota archaeon]